MSREVGGRGWGEKRVRWQNLRQKCHVFWARVLLPWGLQQLRAQFEYKRAQVTNDGHYRRCLSTELGTENDFSEVVGVLVVQVVQVSYLDKENQELLWTAVNVLNYAISILKKKMSRREKANALPITMPV